MMRCRQLVAVLSIVAFPLAAQSPQIAAGTWGAETGGGSVSVMRFRSPSSAWLFGLDASFQRRDQEASGGFPGSDLDVELVTVELSAGIRNYRRTDERTRPFTSLSALVGYQDLLGRVWTVGGSFGMGAAHFFNQHVSLGSSIDLTARYGQGTEDDPFSGEVKTTLLSANVNLRLLASVYF